MFSCKLPGVGGCLQSCSDHKVVVSFSLRTRIWGKIVNPIPACALFFLFFFLKWRSACTHQFHSLSQDQSTVAQQAEMTLLPC